MAFDRDFASQLGAILPRLEGMACFITGSRESARDLVQDTCERAWSRRHQWSGASFDHWVFSILRSRWQDHVRHEAPSVANLDHTADGGMVGDNWAAAQIEAVLQRQDLERIWSQLTHAQREVVGIVHILGHTYAEAAEILQVPIGTIMSRLHRAHRAAARDQAGGPTRR
ncbi:MAG: RNA polymerase sigma factor [Geminicoccaceae bacterium]